MEWRITFFVNRATLSQEGWTVEGEPGLGPLQVGDAFSFILHQDGTQDLVGLSVQRLDGASILVTAEDEVEIRPGDIIGGEVERRR